jgi:hypothetical protein
MATQSINQVKQLFALGQAIATRGALAAMEQSGISPVSLLSRHQRGDWGELSEEDKKSNEDALTNGSRILSAYRFDTVRLWVITEADRSATTILLPEEY